MPSRQAGTPSPTVLHACVFIFVNFQKFTTTGPSSPVLSPPSPPPGAAFHRRAVLLAVKAPCCTPALGLLHRSTLSALSLRAATAAVVLPVECGSPCCLSRAGEAILSVRARVALCAPHHPLAYANTSHAHVLAEHACGIAHPASPVGQRPSGIAHPASPIRQRPSGTTPIRQRPSGNAHPATPIRQRPSGNAHPATPIRQRPSGNAQPATSARTQTRKTANAPTR
jgi:hypothetical protein